MRIEVSDISDSGLKQELTLSLSGSDIVSGGEVRAVLKAVRLGDKVIINGSAASSVSLVCGRCLSEFLLPIKFNFDAVYVPFEKFSSEGEHELTETELDFNFYKDGRIEIEDLVLGHLFLSVPMKPLCSAECRGLCPKCGRNLNEFSCECSTDEVDVRFEELVKFKKSLKKSERS